MRRVVEHWCNNRWGWGRRLVKLLMTDEGWEVYVFSGWGGKEWTFVFGDDESGARAEVEELLTEYGPWKKLTS